MHARPSARANRTSTIIGSAIVTIAAVALIASCGDDDAAGADPVRFCEVDSELEQLDDFTTASPDEARDLVAQTRDLLAEAENVAPDEVSSAVGVTADSFRQALDFYDDADFDVAPAEFEAALASGEVEMFFDPPEAEVVFNWLDENCAS